MEKVLDYPYPEEFFDEHGYPTEEALNYIRNWGSEKNEDGLVFGKFFTGNNYPELIEYIKSIWNYGDFAYKEEDGLFELHTLGWSGNESIVYELENTILWMMKLRAHQVGGHYYFKIDKDTDYDWEVTKVKKD